MQREANRDSDTEKDAHIQPEREPSFKDRKTHTQQQTQKQYMLLMTNYTKKKKPLKNHKFTGIYSHH